MDAQRRTALICVTRDVGCASFMWDWGIVLIIQLNVNGLIAFHANKSTGELRTINIYLRQNNTGQESRSMLCSINTGSDFAFENLQKIGNGLSYVPNLEICFLILLCLS